MRIASLALLLLLAACGGGDKPTSGPVPSSAAGLDPTNASGEEEGTVPSGWQFRFDRGDYTVGSNKDSVDVWFVHMTPGWHLTATPAGIYWHPASLAEGGFTASTKIHLFPPGDRNEGYGLVVGGANLDQPNQTYIYFLIRRSGEFVIKRRIGSNTEELQPWTASDAIVPYTETTSGTTTNVLSVQVKGDQVLFSVNDTEVASLPKGDLVTDGIVGLRVNHGLNMHISEFGVTK